MLRVIGLKKFYGGGSGPALDDVSFEVRNSEILGFVGLNGAGKTTTIRVSAGVSLPSAGTVIVDGQDVVHQKSEASRRIGWVPEYPNFEQNTRAIDLISYFAGFHGIKGSEARRQGEKLLGKVGLDGHGKERLRTYSQGMKKRFSLAAALLAEPPNLLLDEVLNGLDPAGIQLVRSIVTEMKSSGKSVLLSSHILTEVQNIADRVVFIHKGRIIGVSTREEILRVGSEVMRIEVLNMNDAGLSYLETLGDLSSEGKYVTLSRFQIDSSELNAELVKRGFKVKQIILNRPTLEEYFFRLIHQAESGETR